MGYIAGHVHTVVTDTMGYIAGHVHTVQTQWDTDIAGHVHTVVTDTMGYRHSWTCAHGSYRHNGIQT